MSAITIQADKCYDFVVPDMRSRFSISSISSAGSSSQAKSEERQASDDQEDIVATGHKTPQLAISANYGNDLPQLTARNSHLRHQSRRRGLVFPPFIPITVESAPDFVDDDDTVSEAGSEDFDTTMRPQDVISDQEMSAVNHGTGLLVRKGLDTIRPGTSLTPLLKSREDILNSSGASNVTSPRPGIGKDVIGSDLSRPIVKKAMSASPIISRAHPTPGNPSPMLPLSFSHATRRKPVPKLEDYDRLFPARPQPRTVTTGLPHIFPQSILIEGRSITPSSETERDTVRSKSRLPRLHTAHLRESSPLRKILLPFSRSSRQTSPMQNNRISQIKSTADRPPPKLGSPIVLSPSAVPSGTVRTSSSPQSTLVTSLDLSYDTRYLSPASINSKETQFNPTSSVPILPMPSTLGSTPDASSQSEYLHTPRSLGPTTPSSSGSVPTTPAFRRILAFEPTISSSELSSRGSSRCSTPAHIAFPALSLRSIANKVVTIPSTIMKRSLTSKTVTQVAYTQTQVRAVSLGFSRTTSPSPYVLGSPWMGSSEPDDVVSPDSCFYGSSPNEMYQSRNASPLPPPYLPSQSSSFNPLTPAGSNTNLDPSHVDSASPSPRFPPFISPHTRHPPAVDTTPNKLEGHFRGRSKPKPPGNRVFTGIDMPLQVRSRSEGARVRPPEAPSSKKVLKHKGSFRSILGLVKRPSTKEEVGSNDSDEYGQRAHTRYRSGFLEPPIGESNGLLGPPDHKVWAADQGSSFGKGLGLSHSDSGWDRERLQMEITMTRRLVELLDAEHAQDYKRVQAMIKDVREDVARVPRPSRGSSDGESIIDSYMRPSSHGGSVEMKEDAYDSDHSFESQSRTLRAEDIVTDISSFDQKPRDMRGGEIGYWYGMGEPTDDVKS